MHRAPVPAFPAVGIVVHARHADRVGEAEQRREVVADIAPGVVRAVRGSDAAGTVFALLPFDLVGDELDRLLPGDADITRLAAVLRIALAVGVEVDPLHRIEQAVGRIDDGLRILTVRRKSRLARRRELHALRLDGPGRAILFREVDRRHADDLAVLDVDEDRAAVGHVAVAHRAVRHGRAHLQSGGLAHHHGLREPVGEVLRPVDAQHEILLRVDLAQPVDRRGEQLDAGGGILEHQLAIGLRVQPCARANDAIPELKPAADFLVARHDLGDEVPLLEPLAEMSRGADAGS